MFHNDIIEFVTTRAFATTQHYDRHGFGEDVRFMIMDDGLVLKSSRCGKPSCREGIVEVFCEGTMNDFFEWLFDKSQRDEDEANRLSIAEGMW